MPSVFFKFRFQIPKIHIMTQIKKETTAATETSLQFYLPMSYGAVLSLLICLSARRIYYHSQIITVWSLIVAVLRTLLNVLKMVRKYI